MNIVLLMVIGYLLGSISFTYLIVRLVKRIDIRTVGSGNAGGRNVMIHVGLGWGILAGGLDIAKGALAAWLGLELGGYETMGVLVGLMAVLGHNYPFYLGFRGGKGVGASLGVLLMLMPLETLIGAGVLVVLYFLITHSIAFSSGVGFLSITGSALIFGKPTWLVIAPILCLFIGALATIPEAFRMWSDADDKRDLILNRWLREKKGRE